MTKETAFYPRLKAMTAKPQGARLGTPRTTPATTVGKITKLRAQGVTLQAIADELNRLRVPTTRGGSTGRPSSVRSVLVRASWAP